MDAALAGLRAAGLAVQPLIIAPGEASKTLAQAGALYDGMLRAGLDRGSVLVALGGGVVTDLGGFVAATYMRGIAWVAVPTTLLAQVDASVGGKTAVDHPQCKNLIGVFHQPAAVLADVATLATLSEEEFRGGLAEVVKHAVIRDAILFEQLETEAASILARDVAVLEAIVARNIAIKAAVVMADEREGGLRRILNYGHTIGHALEPMLLESAACARASDAPNDPSRERTCPPKPLRRRKLTGTQSGDAVPASGATTAHGRAVALGMVAEAAIAVGRGILSQEVADRQRRLLTQFGLPVRLTAAADVDRSLDLMRHDKKTESGRVRFVVPTSLGATCELDDVTDEEIRAALATLA
jgi:3-dehydroquinate synthase